METLRFMTCGSVDDGKSTLIGRLLYDCDQVPADELATLGTGDGLDFALLVDGLSAEREQGITIDVAYRYFTAANRKFIVADAPGHEQYTRNMVTGASTADLAIVLVDARKGVLTQTRRHTYLAHILGVRRFLLAVTKMDLVGYERAAFDAICADYRLFADSVGITDWLAIPLSGVKGDNVLAASSATRWYTGPTLLEYLAQVPAGLAEDAAKPLRLPVQWVSRPNQDFRGFAGLIASGSVAPGDQVAVLPSGERTRVERIVAMDEDLGHAIAGRSVMLTFAEEIACSRGDVIVASDSPPESADQFEATIVWMSEDELVPGRGYWLKLSTQTVTATVQPPKYEINVNSLERLAVSTLNLNAIGVAEIATDRDIVFEPYVVADSSPNRALGGFILIDKFTNATVAAGMINFALRRSFNIHRQHLDVSREVHARIKGQQPSVLWFTGLSGAGKSTVANLVEKKLVALGKHTFLLDGDNIRHGLNRDLGFTEADRIENIRRVGEVARLMTDAGLIVLAAFISPFRAEREMVRKMFPEGEFVEIFVDAPLREAERRDAKGLYAKARSGELANFTGIDSPYEPPEKPDIHVDTLLLTAQEAADKVIRAFLSRYSSSS